MEMSFMTFLSRKSGGKSFAALSGDATMTVPSLSSKLRAAFSITSNRLIQLVSLLVYNNLRLRPTSWIYLSSAIPTLSSNVHTTKNSKYATQSSLLSISLGRSESMSNSKLYFCIILYGGGKPRSIRPSANLHNSTFRLRTLLCSMTLKPKIASLSREKHSR
ncbi:Uncharacterised protein [Serratia proteamaculans]|nr:Uncharacterised protein [Serratia proteamaculans]